MHKTIMQNFFMGIVIDISKYKTCRDLSLCILENNATKKEKDHSTYHLYLMAAQAKKIIYYHLRNGGWKTTCAFNITQALKTGEFTLKRPEPWLIRLVVHESPMLHIDLYFRRSFYTSEKMLSMLELLVAETIERKSWVSPKLLFSLGRDPMLAANRGIDWDKVRMKKFDEDLPPIL
jgi:hypothetical protein